MSVVTGIPGIVVGQQTVNSFTIDRKRDAKTWVSSGAAGMESQIPGNTDWSGSIDFNGFLPAVLPGSGFTFTGQTDTGKWYTGTAIMESMTVNVNPGTAEVIKTSCKFAANGALSAATGSAKTDVAAPSVYSSISCGATWGTSVPHAINDVQSWSFTMSCALKPYNSADTGAQTLRKAGNKSGSVTVSALMGDPATFNTTTGEGIITPGDVQRLQLFCTPAALNWDLKYCQLESAGQNVNVESADLQVVNYSFKFSGFGLVTGTWTQGFIKTPEGSPTTIYP